MILEVASLEKNSPALWSKQAQSWTSQATPLKPCDEDLKGYNHLLQMAIGNQLTIQNAAILGVTPELYRLLTEKNFNVFCIDNNIQMIETIWPGLTEQAYLHAWQDIDNLNIDCQLFLCDGGLHLLTIADQEKMLMAFDRMTDLSVSLVMRLFLPPNQIARCTSEILSDFESKKYNLSYLKVALWHATDINHQGQVKLSDIWHVLQNWANSDLHGRLTDLGYDKNEIDTLSPYQAATNSYSFLNLDQFSKMIKKLTNFKIKKIIYPNYFLGEQFPVILLNKN